MSVANALTDVNVREHDVNVPDLCEVMCVNDHPLIAAQRNGGANVNRLSQNTGRAMQLKDGSPTRDDMGC